MMGKVAEKTWFACELGSGFGGSLPPPLSWGSGVLLFLPREAALRTRPWNGVVLRTLHVHDWSLLEPLSKRWRHGRRVQGSARLAPERQASHASSLCWLKPPPVKLKWAPSVPRLLAFPPQLVSGPVQRAPGRAVAHHANTYPETSEWISWRSSGPDPSLALTPLNHHLFKGFSETFDVSCFSFAASFKLNFKPAGLSAFPERK